MRKIARQASPLYQTIQQVQPLSEFASVANASHHFDERSSLSASQIREMVHEFILAQSLGAMPDNLSYTPDGQFAPFFDYNPPELLQKTSLNR